MPQTLFLAQTSLGTEPLGGLEPGLFKASQKYVSNKNKGGNP